MKHPLVAPLAAFAAGVIAAQYATFSFRELSASIAALLALALIGLALRADRAAAAACLAGFALCGALVASLPPPPDPNRITTVLERGGFDLRDPVRLRGWVRVPPTVRLDRDQFVLSAESVGDGVPARGGVRVSVIRRAGEPPIDLHYGDHVEFFARLREPRNFENPGGFDRVAFLLRQDIQMTASVRAGVPIERIEGRRGSRLMGWIWRGREWSEKRVDALLGSETIEAGVVKAMVLGDEAYLDRALGVAFQRTGTYHALVVSGSHVGVLAWFFLLAFRLLRIPRGWGSLVTMLLLIGFVLLFGSQLPTIRAGFMVGAYMVGRLFYRERRALNIMAGTALGMIAFDPQNLFDVSFQLSFLSVALIAAVGVPIVEQTLEPYRLALVDLPNKDRDLHLAPKVTQMRIEWRMAADKLPFAPAISTALLCRGIGVLVALGELVIISASIQLGLALPMAVYFRRISWSGLSANLLVIPLMSLIIPLGFGAIVTGWHLLGHVLSGLVALMLAIVEWHARLTWLEARVPAPPVWMNVAFAVTLAAFAWTLGKRKLIQSAAFALLLAGVAALVVHPFAPRVDRGKLEMTALDVGQGESLFLALPQGQTMLLDGGGLATFGPSTTRMPDTGEEVVSPYLWSRSIRALDVLAISHAHYDHIGGLPALLENFRVGELWVGNNPAAPDYDRVLEIARRRGVRLVRLASGDMRAIGGVEFRVLAPPADYTPRGKPSNDDSLVLLARFGERSFLLTGDVEQRSERRLASDGLLPHADLLKIAHHGSKTSSSEPFLAGVTPWLGVISAGFDNPYGHPHRDVLERLEEHRVRVLRTDRDGAVTVSTDGRRIAVWGYRRERR